jgi:hypothetical protein
MSKSDEQGGDGKPVSKANSADRKARRLHVGAYGTALLSLAGTVQAARMLESGDTIDNTAVLSPAENEVGAVRAYLPHDDFDKGLQATGLMGLSALGAAGAKGASHYASAIQAEEEKKKKKKTKGGDEPPEGGRGRS